MYLLQGKLKAKTGKQKELATILIQASKLVSNAETCKLYVVAKQENDPDHVFITEIWESKTDHDESLNLPGVRDLIMTAMPILDGSPQKGQELEILGGHFA